MGRWSIWGARVTAALVAALQGSANAGATDEPAHAYHLMRTVGERTDFIDHVKTEIGPNRYEVNVVMVHDFPAQRLEEPTGHHVGPFVLEEVVHVIDCDWMTARRDRATYHAGTTEARTDPYPDWPDQFIDAGDNEVGAYVDPVCAGKAAEGAGLSALDQIGPFVMAMRIPETDWDTRTGARARLGHPRHPGRPLYQLVASKSDEPGRAVYFNWTSRRASGGMVEAQVAWLIGERSWYSDLMRTMRFDCERRTAMTLDTQIFDIDKPRLDQQFNFNDVESTPYAVSGHPVQSALLDLACHGVRPQRGLTSLRAVANDTAHPANP